MRDVAYCQVSTNKNEQLVSLKSQQNFFNEYSNRNNCNLVKIYADKGKNETKMKNHTALFKLLSNASKCLFYIVLIKDVSRLARNTLDFLINIRKLKTHTQNGFVQIETIITFKVSSIKYLFMKKSFSIP